jgi:hypothetical protein
METNFTKMSGPELVKAYNEMAAKAAALGLNFLQVKRFSDRPTAIKRCEAVAAKVAATAPAPAPAKKREDERRRNTADAYAHKPVIADGEAAEARAAPKRQNGSSEEPRLRDYTAKWNALVPRAEAAGIPGVKVHTSDFESIEKAKKRIAWLEGQLGS